MNANNHVADARRRWLGRAGLVLLLAVGLTPAPALALDPRLQAAEQCAALPSRLGRLECYDGVFHERPEAAMAEQAHSPLWQAVAAQETARDAEDVGVLVGQTDDAALLSVPALGTLPPRPLLVVSCDDLITRFRLHLPEATEATRVRLRLAGQGTALEQTWRVLEGGHVLSGGRGLPAIDTLKRLLGSERLLLRSELAAIDGLRFELTGLHAAIEPLRTMCRW